MTRKERKEAKKREKKRLKAKRARNKEFARVTYVFVALFLVLLGYIGYFQVKKSQEIIRSPYNARQNSNAKRVTRGTIVDRNGNVLAKTDTADKRVSLWRCICTCGRLQRTGQIRDRISGEL